MKKLLLFFLAIPVLFTATAQQNYWSQYVGTGKIITDKSVARLSFPKEFKLFTASLPLLKQELFKVVNNNAAHTNIISLPNTDGALEEFEIVEASNFDAELQAQFPEIRAFSGKGITDKYATLKLSYSPQGIQTMVFRSGKENEFIEPYSQDHSVYAVFKSHRNKAQLPWSCTTPGADLEESINTQVQNSGIVARSGGNLKTMRLAQSVTAEYSNYFGATSATQVSLVLAAINNTLTRCNGVYEKDLALHLNLIAASTNVIYYNASSDPYSNAAQMANWNTQLQNTLTSVIGEANYDVGHLFGATGGGGNAGCIGCVCTNGAKGSGYTSPSDGVPAGDNFDIDYVVHEIGHQLGGNHTFSMSNEGTGVNKEVGSGITIMGYAGITSYDVSGHSIDIYHETTIAQIQTNLNSKSCPVTTTIVNTTPVVNAVSNYTIPISTPFALTGSATDADGDALTYCWEQNDNSTTTNAQSVASPTKLTGPNWLSFRPTISPVRYFPRLQTILAGLNTTGPMVGGDAGVVTEALSSVNRTLNFRLTVRDNAVFSSSAPVSVGQTQFTDMVVTVTNTSGPFTVTSPNTNVSWAGNSAQNITWNVAGTTASPVSCANVKISLSTDGGLTFPAVLIASTPNDGSQSITLPNTATTAARIKIEAIGNIFFDISNSNFTITASASCGTPTGLAENNITINSADLSWNAVAGALNYDVDYKLNASSTWTSFSVGQTGTTANLTGLSASSIYDWREKATCVSGSGIFATSQFTTVAGACNAPAGLASSSVTSSSAIVSWNLVSGALSYDVDYKLNASSAWISFSTAQTGTSANLTGLSSGSLYDWRVRTNCSGSGSSFVMNQFTTLSSGCASAFEPNESLAAAATISAGVAHSAAINTSTDKDYYQLITTGTNNISYALAGPVGVDYDLKIYNSTGTQIGSGTSSTANETVTLNNQAAGTYYVYIYGYNGANSATCYTITATVTPVSAGCQSSYDNSTNGTYSGAAQIPLNTDVHGLINPKSENDYYRFVITTGGTATITLSTLPADYDMRLYSSNGTTQLAISQNGGTTSETISRTFTAGTYYARVYGYKSAFNASNCYTLRISTGTATREEKMPLFSSKNLIAYPNPVNDILNIQLKGITGNSSFRLFDINGRQVASGKTINANYHLNMRYLPAGVYLLQVIAASGEIFSTKVVKQ
ncbi:MAG: T9SS type A sorting domain-containing protein [Chitinophagaceae bacterium]|nr:T9SS type A sorting domain-containing protein [Chitinophagaceae bacterium]